MSTLTMYDRVRETTTTSGTGTLSLLGAVTGYQSFSASVGNGNACYYTCSDQSGSNWEVGIGTYTSSGSTLSRSTVLASSNSNSLVSFGSNTKDVFVTAPASILSEIMASPITVANGGTGDTSLTAYAVLCGGTTSTGVVQSVSGVGTSGQVLTSNGAAALPTWQAAGGGGSGTVSTGTLGQVAYYAANGTTVSGRAGVFGLFTATATATVANTGSETTLIGSGVGSLTIPSADLYAGKTVRVKARGYWSTLGIAAGNITINLKGGSTVLATTGAVAVPLSQSSDYWEVDAEIVVYSTGGAGTVWTQGKFLSENTTLLTAFIAGMTNTSNSGISPLSSALNLTATWSAASSSNTITCTGATIDSVN